MEKGLVKWFNAERGYGFIQKEDGTDIFVYFKDINMTGYKTLNDGEKVEFQIEHTDKGDKAVNVTTIEE
jgi:CspA family cold shock protein